MRMPLYARFLVHATAGVVSLGCRFPCCSFNLIIFASWLKCASGMVIIDGLADRPALLAMIICVKKKNNHQSAPSVALWVVENGSVLEELWLVWSTHHEV